MPAAIAFSWVPFYRELAKKLLPYRQKQSELVSLLQKLRLQGLTITPLEDKDAGGQRFQLQEIDPFTFFGVFNRGIADEMRRRILLAVKNELHVDAEVPSDFSGIPVLDNRRSWFFAYKADRGPGDIDALWEVFALALGKEPLDQPTFRAAFDKAVEIQGIKVNLTMGLFWIRPDTFFALDSVMREFLGIALPKPQLNAASYRDLIIGVKSGHTESFPELSYSAWLQKHQSPPPAVGTAGKPAKPIPTDISYWMVGAYWQGSDPADQTERFLRDDIWENGYEDKYLELVRQMKAGDRIAIKAAVTQKEGLPFDAGGRTVSKMLIKATGTVVSNKGDGRRVEVDWDPSIPTREWYFYTGRATVWKLKLDDEYAQRLIRFAFFGEPQDFDFFINRWWGSDSEPELPADTDGVTATPYSREDMVSEGVFLTKDEINRLLDRLLAKKNLILQGAPGVGKTFVAMKLAYAAMEARDSTRRFIVQFHPSYTYEDFVRGFRPVANGGFELVDGPFLEICRRAADDPDRTYVLIVDEINRGNVSQIFGELMVLLEHDKRGRLNAVTPMYRRTKDEKLFVPENLYVIGTMNIADRSLALVDYALRRRFAFFTLVPRYADGLYKSWMGDSKVASELTQKIVQRMCALNEQIGNDSQLGRGFQIGHSFFCPPNKESDFSHLTDSWYRAVVETEIVPLLEEYWYDSPEKVEAARNELLK